MEFLIDNNISPKVADSLSQNGFGSVHVKKLGMSAATEDAIFGYANENNLTIISADTDFGFILSTWQFNRPSVILLRHISPLPEIQAKYLLNVIDKFATEIEDGSLLVITPEKLRIRKLPLF